MTENIRAVLRTIPNGWFRVLRGKTYSGDRWWSTSHSAWLPVTGDDWLGCLVSGDYVPTVIRRGDGSLN